MSERLKDKINYGIYCVNMFGSALNSIKAEFKRQVHTGLRQTVFLLDVDEIQTEIDNQHLNQKTAQELQENSNIHLMDSILKHIEEFSKSYEMQIQKINEELMFDLYQYWLKGGGDHKKIISNKTKNMKPSKGSKDAKHKDKNSCTSTLIVNEHNRQDGHMLLSKRKYIQDEPSLGKLYIIILGRMSTSFYVDLLSLNQPLEGIINFIPIESKYHIELGNNKLRNYIHSTLDMINYSNREMRQEIVLKPVGLFTHELPVISNYLATKHSREIFDQLTWSIYDTDVLRQQYEKYYFEPFQITDVEIPASDNLTELYHIVETLNIKGSYQKFLLPTSDVDLASVATYLNSLLNICALQENLQNESQQENLNRSQDFTSFSTITNISKYGRLVVAENNKLLLNLLQHTDLEKFNSIYTCCMNYNAVGPYATLQQQKSSVITRKPYTLILPQFVKYYADKDCICQRIVELTKVYDEYEIRNISSGYTLYTFRRIYNVLSENEGSAVIPTRLCFRDFTLFKMEEFLKDLQKPELDTNYSYAEKQQDPIEFDESIFVRPKSLKFLMLQKEERLEQNKNEYHPSKSAEENSSKSFSKVEENQGLPPDHNLLKGYNLGDTLQEIKHKISKYYFRQGSIKLYEEKWCFQEMNKQLSLSINNATLFFSSPREQLTNISNNFRLITKHNIAIRVLNDLNECSKIVMNYPNGLSVFHHGNDCEQIWYCELTPLNEHRRIFTNLGAIIVFFKSCDLIKIMRYNGEVYRLYQHEPSEEEEELYEINEYEDIEKKSSVLEDAKAQGDSLFVNERVFRARTEKTSKQSNVDAKQSRHSLKHSSEKSTKSSSIDNRSEMIFLNLLCSIYDLTYFHLIITSSQGKCINLTRQGKIFEGHSCSINEWQDYFANEAYCERSDGVKMIWSQDSFKCFHNDGTVFTTTVEDDLQGLYEDELDDQISNSSSHLELLDKLKDNKLSVDNQKLTTHEKLTSTYDSTYTIPESAEEHKTHDMQFMRYKCKSWIMQHQNYAKVHVISSKVSNLRSRVEIFGIDNVRTYIQQLGDDDEAESEEFREDKTVTECMVHVWIGESLHVKANNESCNIYAVMPNSKVEKEIKSDCLSLNLKYTDHINDVFKDLVNKISSWENNLEQELEELYFIKKLNADTSMRGFEFFTSLPIISNYKHRVSNTVTEIRAVNTISESVISNCEGHKEHLNKFPRFKQKPQQRSSYSPVDKLPRFLSANVFIEIPKQLLSLSKVIKFLEPFEDVNFKSLRRKFKNALSLLFEPQQQLHLKILSSKRSWEKRHCEHEKRIFAEKQRLGLYKAMNKHKIYPNFWEFTQDYGSDIRQIEFFHFMKAQCCK